MSKKVGCSLSRACQLIRDNTLRLDSHKQNVMDVMMMMKRMGLIADP